MHPMMHALAKRYGHFRQKRTDSFPGRPSDDLEITFPVFSTAVTESQKIEGLWPSKSLC
jgi:hypothetical protein